MHRDRRLLASNRSESNSLSDRILYFLRYIAWNLDDSEMEKCVEKRTDRMFQRLNGKLEMIKEQLNKIQNVLQSCEKSTNRTDVVQEI